MISIGRRTLGTVAALLFALSAVPHAQAAEKELKLAHFMAPTHPYHPQVFEWLDARLDERTGGTLGIRIFPGGELGAGPEQQFSRAVDGIADIAMGLPGYTARRFPRTLLMEYPGVAASPDKAADGLWNAFELLAPEYERVKVIGMWTITPAAIFSHDKPVRSLEDLEGMKVRVASKVGGDVAKAWGATPVFMPVTEIYNAMQTGVVDATLIDPGAALAFKLNEVSDHMTVGMNSILTTFYLVMNRDAWAGLSDDHKAAMEEFIGPTLSNRAHQIWTNVSDKGRELMESGERTEVIELSADEAAKFDAASRDLLQSRVAELEAEGIPAKQVVEALGLAD